MADTDIRPKMKLAQLKKSEKAGPFIANEPVASRINSTER